MAWEDDTLHVEGLGTIIIHGRDYNLTVKINGVVAWSYWRESRAMCKLSINGKVREWKYLNSFIASKA